MSDSSKQAVDPATPNYRVGDLLIDPGRQRVMRGDDVISLPRLSYELLMALVDAAPNLVSNDTLMEHVWPKAVVSPETLSQRVKLLRDALGDDPRQPRYVEGLRGRGYRLIPTVERNPQTAAVPLSTEIPSRVEESRPARATLFRRPWIMGTIVAAAGVTAALIGWQERKRSAAVAPMASVDVVAVQPRAVAVLPFDNLSTEAGNEYIALGVAESVLNRLGSIRELIVIARSSSFELGKSARDAREIRRKLGVGYLVEGSVQRMGKKLRVNAQLIDTARNSELWSLSFDRTIDDVFAVQDEIAQRVAEKLEVSLREPSAQYAQYGTDAYLEFLQGRALFESRKISDIESSIRHFSRALELAPTFAAAMTDLGYAKLQLASLHNDFNKQAHTLMPEIQALADRAIRLDPAAGAAYYLRAQVRLDDPRGVGEAWADFRKAFDLAPNYALGVYNYADFLFNQERYEEALALLDRAILLDPLAPSSHYLRGEILRSTYGRPDQAAASYQQALAVAPEFYPATTRLAMVRFIEGNLAEAIKLGEKSIVIEPKVGWTRERLVWFYLHLDDVGAARDVARGFDAGYVNARFDDAMICYRTGDLERAERLTRTALKDPDAEAGDVIFSAAVEAIVERALATHSVGAARQFILGLPGLKLDHGKMAIVEENWPFFVQFAVLERQTGNLGAATDLAEGILAHLDDSHYPGPPGINDWTRASALAVLGRNDEALTSLEHMAHVGNRMRWWITLERDPNFASLRGTPRFQALARDTRVWLEGQQRLLQGMRQRGEVPRRNAAPLPGSC